MLAEIRIPARVEVIVRTDDRPVSALIRRHSKEADLVFMGMSLAAAGSEEQYAAELLALLDGLPHTILVQNAGPFRGRLV